MISVNKRLFYGSVFNDVRCLSTDSKPTNVLNGSTLTEIDTGKRFMFDGGSKQWHEQPSIANGNQVSF
jgi:hypothetical protein